LMDHLIRDLPMSLCEALTERRQPQHNLGGET